MNCVVVIAGREAVPVRAIPFVTGWQSFSPDAVAEGLAHRLESGKLEGLTAYHIASDGSISAMLPKEWDGPARALDALSAKLDEMEGDSYPAWREQSIPELPSHCFVWRDELEKNVTNWWRKLHLVDERPGDKELNFAPRIPPRLEGAIFEGMPKENAAASMAAREQDTPNEAVQAEPANDQGNETIETCDLVGWQRALLECWPRISAAYQGKPSALKAMSWLKKNGPRDVIPKEHPMIDSMEWIGLDGTIHTVKRKTVQNVLAAWKKAGKLPV